MPACTTRPGPGSTRKSRADRRGCGRTRAQPPSVGDGAPPCAFTGRVALMSDEPRMVFVISDATGETAEKVVRAAMLQFEDAPVQLRMYTRVRLEEEMRNIVARAHEKHALVVFT